MIRMLLMTVLVAVLLQACSKSTDKAKTEDAGDAGITVKKWDARDEAESKTCLANLKMVGIALSMYASDNRDRYPIEKKAQDFFVECYLKYPKARFCPKGGEYRFLVCDKSLEEDPENDSIIVICPNEHGDCCNVLLKDGSVHIVPKEELDKAIQQTPKGDYPVLK